MKPLTLVLVLASLAVPSLPARAETRVASTTDAGGSALLAGYTSSAEPPAPATAAPAGPSRVLMASYMQSANGTSSRSGLGVEASGRLDGPVYLHGGLVYGGTSGIVAPLDFAAGSFMQLRVGLEGRSDSSSVRAIGGIDLAYQRDTLGYNLVETLVAIPRFGVELGNTVRVRGMIEVPLELADYSIDGGLGISAGLGAAF